MVASFLAIPFEQELSSVCFRENLYQYNLIYQRKKIKQQMLLNSKYSSESGFKTPF